MSWNHVAGAQGGSRRWEGREGEVAGRERWKPALVEVRVKP